MKKIAFIILAAALTAACGGGKKANNTQVEEVAAPVEEQVADTHNSRNSLDYAGTYKGVLPCADCEGIRTEITINGDGTYVLKQEYIGPKNTSESHGKYTWNEAGNAITLEDELKPNRYMVGENKLTKLDIDGYVVKGEHADMYILAKI